MVQSKRIILFLGCILTMTTILTVLGFNFVVVAGEDFAPTQSTGSIVIDGVGTDAIWQSAPSKEVTLSTTGTG